MNSPTTNDAVTMATPEKVATLSEYMAWVVSVRPYGSEHEHTLFYRGHSDSTYKLEPSVYRTNDKGESFRSVEHQLYAEMLRQSPTDFCNDKSLFERLVRMQHYELPSRLLDFTLSPLIALYFACCSGEDDGEVILFSLKSMTVMHPSDIPDRAWVGVEQVFDATRTAAQCVLHLRKFFENKKAELAPQAVFGAEFAASLDIWIGALDSIKGMVTDLLEIATEIGKIETAMQQFVEKWGDHFKAVAKEHNALSNQVIEALQSNEHILKFRDDFYQTRTDLIQIVCDVLRIKDNQH